jgi:small multidrug resistance pump
MQHWLILGIAIIAETMATTALKASEGWTRLMPSILVVLGYGTSFYCLSLTLKVIPVGVVYAIWSGIGIVLIAILGWLWFGQKLDLPAIAGMGLIIGGVIVINFFSKTVVN